MGAKIKRLLGQGQVVRVLGVGQLCHPKFVEIVGQQGGYDAVWFDQEHCGLTLTQIEDAARAARGVGLDHFVRLTATDYSTTMRPLEAGAGGIMAAMVRSAKEAADVVRWARFHPQGMRGVNGTGVDGRYGTLPLLEYFRQANEENLVAIQIEHIDAVEDVEKIAAVPGVDLLFIGPADLSQTMGVPGQWDSPLLWKAIERVAAACKARNVPWAVLPLSLEFGRRCLDLGCTMLSIGMDVWLLQRGIKAFLADYNSLG